MPVERDTTPNVLLILCDQLRADALGCYGNDLVGTPNLDRLAAEGTTFTDCQVTQPTCTPSRASILTGMYPSALQSRMVGCYTPDSEVFFPRQFRQAGYLTASVGKNHLVPQRAERQKIMESAVDRDHYDYYGFEKVDPLISHGDRCRGPKYDRWVKERLPGKSDPRDEEPDHYEHGSKTAYEYRLPEACHSSNYVGERVEEFVESRGDEPFFLHASFPDPHWPFTVPEPYASMYDRDAVSEPIPPIPESTDPTPLQEDLYNNRGHTHQRPDGDPAVRMLGVLPQEYHEYDERDWREIRAIYYGMVSLIDEKVGRMLDALDEAGIAENTVVVFLSDHGEMLGDHGLIGKGLPFDSSIRVPCIARGPGVESGRRIDSVASTLDIAPTLLEMADIEEPTGVQGASMVDVLGGAEPTRSAALTEHDDDFVPTRARTLTTADWKLTYYLNEEYGELYDREADPEETENLWNNPDYRDVKRELREMLLDEVVSGIDFRNRRKQRAMPRWKKWIPEHNT